MEELYINNISIELPPNSISQTKQINDIAELKDRQSNYSNNIKIPKTPNNNATFEMLGLVGTTTRIPYIQVDVKYTVDGIELIADGKGIVKNTNSFFNLVIYDGNIALSDLLGNKQLSALDFSAYNHTLTSSLFISSFSNTSGYIYGIANFFSNIVNINQTISFTSPSFFIYTLFEMIFIQNGYTITGDFLSNADYKCRVVSMNNGYIRDITENITLKYDVNHSADPTVVDAFGTTPTTKDYTLDEYTATSTVTHKVTIVGELDLIRGDNPRFIVSVDGTGDIIPIDDVFNINIDVEIAANSGNLITVALRVDSIEHVGIETITFNTEFTTKIYENDLSIPINFNELFGATRQIDFVKDVMQRFGLIYRKTKNKNEFEFKTMGDLLVETSLAEDWSSKYSSFINETYKPNYAKENYAKYIYDSSEEGETYADGTMVVDNINLSNEKTLFTSIYKASELSGNLYQLNHWKEDEVDDVISYLPNDDGLRIFKINNSSGVISYRYSRDVLLPVNFSGTIPFLNFSSVFYQNELDVYYPEIKAMLDNYRKITLELNLSVLDIYQLDFFKLKYFNQLGQYYYLNKIINFKKGRKTKVELVEIGELIPEFIFLSGTTAGTSTATATISALTAGEMQGFVYGTSTAIGTLGLGVTAFNMSNVGDTEVNACSETPDTEHYHDGGGVDPAVNDTVYTDSGGTTPKPGNDEYFKISGNRVIKINTSGVVTIKTTCI